MCIDISLHSTCRPGRQLIAIFFFSIPNRNESKSKQRACRSMTYVCLWMRPHLPLPAYKTAVDHTTSQVDGFIPFRCISIRFFLKWPLIPPPAAPPTSSVRGFLVPSCCVHIKKLPSMKMKQTEKTAATSPGKEEEAVAPGGFRKGPWTEQEDMKLAWFVRLFGERRWDFLAKVSGLNRTGKSCRLRWVNYLHPDLKRGRMSPEEERLVVDLHARWGNRWSRIAKAMPGRTDNEIKNYWRTHTRKLHKDTRAAADGAGSGSASASTTTSTFMSAVSPATTSSSSSSTTDNDNHANQGHGDEETAASHEQAHAEQLFYTGVGAMDSHLLWNDAIMDTYAWGAAAPSMIVPPPSSPVWDYCCSDSLWWIGDDEVEYKKMLAVAGAS